MQEIPASQTERETTERPMITVLLVDDHGAFRKSLRSLLEKSGEITVLATASNGQEALEQAKQYCPHVALMDLSMPVMDGIEATRHLQMLCRPTRVLILSSFDQALYVRRALRVGAAGYIIKDDIGRDLLPAIRALHEGERYFSRKIAGIARRYLERGVQD